MIVWKFTDPLQRAQDYEFHASEPADVQRCCDRLRLLVRGFGYPVFHDPTLPGDVIHISRFDPHDMTPIEPHQDSRSPLLRPCIYVASAAFIRTLVNQGRPPLSPPDVLGGGF